MFNVKNLKRIFLVLLLAGAAPALCMAGDKGNHGTRVNAGAHANFTNGSTLHLVVQYLNPSNNPITINEIKIYRPDGTEVSPDFSGIPFPEPPFDLGPFEAKGFHFNGAGISTVTWPPMGVFQVHTTWETGGAATSLKSFSVVITNSPGSGVVSKIAVEGFDLPGGKEEEDDDDGSSD